MTIPIPAPGPGYIGFSNNNGELNDQGLYRFLQQLVVGITGLPATLVWPRWQPEPPNQPDFGTDWCAIGQINREREPFAAIGRDPTDTFDIVIRNEILTILASFYGPNAEASDEAFTMGLSLAQNREAAFLNGFGLVEVRESAIVPELLKNRWVPRVDTPFRLRRQQVYQYGIPNLVQIDATVLSTLGSLSIVVK